MSTLFELKLSYMKLMRSWNRLRRARFAFPVEVAPSRMLSLDPTGSKTFHGKVPLLQPRSALVAATGKAFQAH
jgi:hypothetical protein